ncbi:MAG TPA: cytochrome C oxidase subunit IV family protein [Actinomycetota bacterium]|nr:cytochrome C oxidase subunit IV family protein [Actinomycetota bacterium]
MSDIVAAVEADAAAHPVEHVHPGPWEYLKIAFILALLTALEVSVYYLSSLKSILPGVLIGLAIVKFSLVALYFMHLKFDTRLFRRLLTLGIILAITVYTIAITTLFKYL